MKNSEEAKPIYRKALAELGAILDEGRVEDGKFLTAVIAGLNLFTKLLNHEQREASLRFSIGKRLEKDVEELKKTLKKTIPEYVVEE